MMSNRIKMLRKKARLSQSEFAKLFNVSQSTVSNWENNAAIDKEYLIAIASYFRTSVDYILGTETEPSTSSASGVRIPVLGYIRAGIPIAAIEDILDWEEISESLAKRGEYVGLRVKGNSMYPEIKDGDVAIIRRQEEVEDGEIAAVIINGDEATLKKIKKTDQGIILIGLNVAEYEPHPYSFEQIENLPVRIYGKLIEVRRKYG